MRNPTCHVPAPPEGRDACQRHTAVSSHLVLLHSQTQTPRPTFSSDSPHALGQLWARLSKGLASG